MKRILSFFLTLLILFGTFLSPVYARTVSVEASSPSAVDTAATEAECRDISDLSEETVRSKMLALKSQYPEGTPFTNEANVYTSKGLLEGDTYYTGYGCVAFAFVLSDAAFDDRPMFKLKHFTFEELRVGDMLRVNNNAHTVIIIEKKPNSVVLAEGNYNSSVHWGRTLSKSEVLKADYVLTRYPDTLERHSTPIIDGEINICKNDPIECRYFRFKAEDDGWSAFIKTDQWSSFLIYNEDCRIIDGFSIDGEYLDGDEDEDARKIYEYYFEKTYDCEKGKYVYLRFNGGSGTQTASVLLSNCNPDKLPTDFLDVKPGQFFVKPVLWAAENKITKGVDQYRFCPNATCTRAQVVTFLWRAMGSPKPTTKENPFTDVDTNSYYYKALLWAVENKITAGTTPTTFSPDDPCTRAQVVTFLWRAEGKPKPTTQDNPFSDVTGGFYYNAVLWAVEKNITAGTTSNTFSPEMTCTRGQIVTFLYRDIK